MRPTRRFAGIAAIVTATAGLLAGSGIVATAANASDTFIGPLNHTKVIASTVPANGDVNPYGVAVVRASTGNLVRGDVLVSNFNAKKQQSGDRHDHRAGIAGGPAKPVCPDPQYPSPAPVPVGLA